jgi:nitroreductase
MAVNSMTEIEATDLLRRAAIQATLAPSVHNTQPWRLELRDNALELHLDRSRQLQVLDPSGRQSIISCGCALFNARVALAAAGYEAKVERFPHEDLLAQISVPDQRSTRLPIAELSAMIERRQSNRRHFEDAVVPPEVVTELIAAANAEGGSVFVPSTTEQRIVIATLSQHADALQNADPAYRAELRAWTSNDPNRRDGVPGAAVPHLDAGSEDDLPIRDFDTHGMGWLPVQTRSSISQCLLLLGTGSDDALSWLCAGEALQRLWLYATQKGYVASLLTQVVEIASTRSQLRAELNLPTYPHVLLRVGRAPTTPASRRRQLSDVLFESLS